MRILLPFLLFATPDTAEAFCGTYVGQAGAELYNNASQIAITRQGTRTTLTIANDFVGDVTEFALVVPIPEVITAADVSTASVATTEYPEGQSHTEMITRLDAYSGPRLVSYTCNDFQGDDSAVDVDGADSGGGGTSEDAESVTVEASFSVGEYDIEILSATDGASLVTWLNANGYSVPTTSEALLGEYLEAGSKMFAAKVNLEELAEDPSYLSALQFGYDSEVFSLPIRLGTLNSTGEQDMILYILSDNGRVGVSNYPEAQIENECMFNEADYGTFGAFYDLQFSASLEGLERPGWLLEYGWSAANCDPCSDEPISDEEVARLGFDGLSTEAYFSRIHMRYAPEKVDQELSLYVSGDYSNTQVRYIQYLEELEEIFPICGVGMVEDGGSCDTDTGGETDTNGQGSGSDSGDGSVDGSGDDKSAGGCGCTAAPGPFAGLFLALVAVARRRQRVLTG